MEISQGEKKKAISGQHVALEVDFSMNISSLPSSWLFSLHFLVFFAQRCWLLFSGLALYGFQDYSKLFLHSLLDHVRKRCFKNMLK